jgi:alkylation response protein AidB-like acyl-CoA dehydrogenase
MGMIGTGSHTVVVEPQQIPTAWTFQIEHAGSIDYGPMSVAAGNGIWPIGTAVAAIQLGTARRALDAAADLLMKKPGAFRTRPLIENSHVQRQLMRAEGPAACHAGVEHALEQLWRMPKESPLALATRLALVVANAHASAAAI